VLRRDPLEFAGAVAGVGSLGLDGLALREAEKPAHIRRAGDGARGDVEVPHRQTPGLDGEAQPLGRLELRPFDLPSGGDVLDRAEIAHGPWLALHLLEGRLAKAQDPADRAVLADDAVLIGLTAPNLWIESQAGESLHLGSVVRVYEGQDPLGGNLLILGKTQDCLGTTGVGHPTG
jgi:hypothetical protein